MRVYFRDRAERDALAQELNPEEVPTTGGYLTVIRDRALFDGLTARGLRVEIDENSSRNLSDPQLMTDTFYSGYKTVEEIYAYLDQKVAAFPGLVEKVDIGDSWCKLHPGSCTLPAPWNGYDLFALHITNRSIPGPKPVVWMDGDIHAREIATPEVVIRLIDYLTNNYATDADVHWLVDHHDIWLMPEVNPDGHHIVEAGGNGNEPVSLPQEWRQRRRRRVLLAALIIQSIRRGQQPQLPLPLGLLQRLERFCLRSDLSRDCRRDRSRRLWPSSTSCGLSCPTSAVPATPTRRRSLPRAFTRTSTPLCQ